jgi:flagellar biogenesis protein FliO
LLTYLFFAFLAAFFLGAAFFLAAFFFVAMFLNLKWLVKKLIDSKNRKFFKLSKVFSTFLKTWMWKN